MTYLTTILTDAPIHCWPLTEAAGLISADIGSASALPFISRFTDVSSGLGYTGPDSQIGSAMLTATRDALQITAVVSPMVAPCTWEIWDFQHSPIATAFAILWWHGADGTHNWSMGYNLGGAHYAGVNGTQITDPVAAPMLQWHHWAATLAGGLLSFYKDGVLVNTAAPPATAFGLNRTLVGNYDDLAHNAEALVSCPALYSTALSAARILAHYNAANQRTLQPTSQFSGTFVTGSGFPQGGLNTDVINAVRRTYQNAP